MSLYESYLLPHVNNCDCGSRSVMKQRAKVISRARGTVLKLRYLPGTPRFAGYNFWGSAREA